MQVFHKCIPAKRFLQKVGKVEVTSKEEIDYCKVFCFED